MAKIGLIQTRGLGDIIIALPIAAAFTRRGHTVYWPVNAAFVPFLQYAAPTVRFIPVSEQSDPRRHYLTLPQEELRRRECDETYVLYSAVSGDDSVLQRKELADFLKFDEYKYAVTGVPFSEKWTLKIERDAGRERRLFESLGVRRKFVCVHRTGTQVVSDFRVPEQWRRDYDIVELDERTDSPFDWIYTLEQAAILVCIDSCFANLVEQLNLPNEKHLILRNPNPFMPVLKNGWRFIRLG
jgi:hypothetical protein